MRLRAHASGSASAAGAELHCPAGAGGEPGRGAREAACSVCTHAGLMEHRLPAGGVHFPGRTRAVAVQCCPLALEAAQCRRRQRLPGRQGPDGPARTSTRSGSAASAGALRSPRAEIVPVGDVPHQGALDPLLPGDMNPVREERLSARFPPRHPHVPYCGVLYRNPADGTECGTWRSQSRAVPARPRPRPSRALGPISRASHRCWRCAPGISW